MKSFTNVKVLFPLLLITIIFCGCVKPPYLIIYNNTESDLTATFINEKIKESFIIKSKNEIKLLYPSYARKVNIYSHLKGKTLVYKLKWPAKEFINENFTDREIFLQLDPNTYIYILKKENFPAKEFPEQPQGYPLKPRQ